MNHTPIVLGLLMLMVHSMSPQDPPRVGWIAGTAAVISGREDPARPVPRCRLVLRSRGVSTTVVANDNGDYVAELLAGSYELIKVVDESGRQLRIDAKQPRDFSIAPGKVTRFDVALRAGGGPSRACHERGPGPVPR